jgi:7,8-dihydropterin-6-yl-methyl-4-(beta-D-ribofuranosyl)aminobenzene 5'-phosphate synthase
VSKMEVRVISVYNDKALEHSRLIGSRGISWFIEMPERGVLFDTGMKGEVLLHNLSQLGLHPNVIDTIVLSHAHNDHTGGLPALLAARTKKTPVTVIAHPGVLEAKRAARLMDIGMPNLELHLQEKVIFKLDYDPVTLEDCLFTTGEITHRPEKDGTGWIMQHCVDGFWKQDPILDDISLVLKTKDGLVVICGCCHAGLLNTLNHVSKTFKEKIVRVLGGTHMRSYTRNQMTHIGNVIEKRYSPLRMDLGHCTGRKQVKWLQRRFGAKFVEPMYAGSEYVFEVDSTPRVALESPQLSRT